QRPANAFGAMDSSWFAPRHSLSFSPLTPSTPALSAMKQGPPRRALAFFKKLTSRSSPHGSPEYASPAGPTASVEGGPREAGLPAALAGPAPTALGSQLVAPPRWMHLNYLPGVLLYLSQYLNDRMLVTLALSCRWLFHCLSAQSLLWSSRY